MGKYIPAFHISFSCVWVCVRVYVVTYNWWFYLFMHDFGTFTMLLMLHVINECTDTWNKPFSFVSTKHAQTHTFYRKCLYLTTHTKSRRSVTFGRHQGQTHNQYLKGMCIHSWRTLINLMRRGWTAGGNFATLMSGGLSCGLHWMILSPEAATWGWSWQEETILPE